MTANPYQPPQSQERVYYTTNIVAASREEIRRVVGNPGFIAWAIIHFHKLIHRPIFAGFGIAHDSLEFLPIEAVPTYASECMAVEVDEVNEQQGSFLFAHKVDCLGRIETWALDFLLPERSICGAVLYTRSELNGKPVEQTEVYCGSIHENDDRITTTSSLERLDTPSEFHGEYLPDASFAELVARQTQRMEEMVSPAIPFDEQRLKEYLLANSRRNVKFQLGRKVMIPLSDTQVANLRAETAANAQANR